MPYLFKGLLKTYEDMIQALLMLKVFLRLKICSLVLHPARKPACSSAMISSAWGLSLLSSIFNMTLLGWLMRLIVLKF